MISVESSHLKTGIKEIRKALAESHVLPETTLLVCLCTFDMLFTLYCVRVGLAREANPMLKQSLSDSNLHFIFLKAATFLVPVTCLELLRRYRPRFVASALRMAFVGYLAIYLGGSIALAVRF